MDGQRRDTRSGCARSERLAGYNGAPAGRWQRTVSRCTG